MAGAKLEKTRWPGIYRRGQRWVYVWTDATGKQRRGTAATRDEASASKAAEEDRTRNGQAAEAGPVGGRLKLNSYARELYGCDLDREPGTTPERGRYQGRRGAIREGTRNEYRRDVERYWLPVLGHRLIGRIATPELFAAVTDLAARDGDDYLTDRTIRRAFAPLAALLATAVEEGLIDANPARDVRLPSGRDALRRFDQADVDGDDPDAGRARALTHDQVRDFLLVVHPDWHAFFALLATTGLRVSEAIALRWQDLRLDGDRPVVRVRRARVNGRYGPPKSRHGRRDVPLDIDVVRALRSRRKASEWFRDGDLVFPSLAGTPVRPENVLRRVLKPAAEEAGVPWAAFHAFRHHCASALIGQGRNVVQVSRWLGHHSPSFTLDTYAHLMDEGVGEPISLGGDNPGTSSALRVASAALDTESKTARLRGISEPA